MLVEAIKERKLIKFWYKNLWRIAEPYTYGIHKDTDNEVLSAYQIDGFSHSGELPGWRLYLLSETSQIQKTDKIFTVARPGYNPNDSRMNRIFARF